MCGKNYFGLFGNGNDDDYSKMQRASDDQGSKKLIFSDPSYANHSHLFQPHGKPSPLNKLGLSNNDSVIGNEFIPFELNEDTLNTHNTPSYINKIQSITNNNNGRINSSDDVNAVIQQPYEHSIQFNQSVDSHFDNVSEFDLNSSVTLDHPINTSLHNPVDVNELLSSTSYEAPACHNSIYKENSLTSASNTSFEDQQSHNEFDRLELEVIEYSGSPLKAMCPPPTISIYESAANFIRDTIAWTYIQDPFCAVTSVCSILLNNVVFMNYISDLNDILSFFLKNSLESRQDPFDVLAIPQVLWDSDPVEILNKIYRTYSNVPDFDFFNATVISENVEHCLSNICVDVKDSFESSLNDVNVISTHAMLTISIGRYFPNFFNDSKFTLPLSYKFNEDFLDLYGFIYVIHPLTNASHYISVIKKGNSFYVCNGSPRKIDNINEFMLSCNIVTCFYVNNNFELTLNPSRDFDEGSLFTLGEFEFFKFHLRNPFLNKHPEYYSPDYIDDFPIHETIEEHQTQVDQCYIPSEDDLSGETLDFDLESLQQNDNPDECDSPITLNSTEVYDDLSLSEFLSMNRFLYDALMILDLPTIKSVAGKLEMSVKNLKNNLIENKITRNMNELKELALNIELTDPPPVYTFLSNLMNSAENFVIDSRYIEFTIPVSYFHFDYYNLLYNRSSFPKILKKGLPKNFDFQEILPSINQYFNIDNDSESSKVSEEFQIFQHQMIDMYNNMPDLFKKINGDQRFLLNSNISVAFLYGNVEIAKSGIGSPHLKGTFSMSARKENTGYLNLDSLLFNKKELDSNLVHEICAWLKENNPLYEDFTPLNIEYYQARIEPKFAPRNEVIGIATLPLSSNQPNTPKNVDFNKLPISLPDSDGNKILKYVNLEEALTLCFPMIFPYGNIPKIPGKTLKEKSQTLLSTHEFYRCGRLQCSLILFLYNAIMSHNASFVQNKLTFQKTNIPNGASREIPPNMLLRNDPAMPEYWLNRQSQVRAMCSELGDPDLMITFTFVNKWPEVKECEDFINNYGFDKVDIRFCPFEEMMIWNNRFAEIKKNSFNDLIKFMNFGSVTNYCWRLEFQARGAPHVHALIWLEQRLSLQTISQNFFAHLPEENVPRLHNLVTNNMIHSCFPQRCKGGNIAGTCKYGFPKPSCADIHVDSDGKIILPRRDDESRIVEYSPYFLLKWGGHCHTNILLHEGLLECSANAIYYIVKYNFKNEPNLIVEVGNTTDASYKTRFHARIVSVEEATTKIVSVDYFGASMASIYISIKPPEERQATFKNGEQTQLTYVEKYFSRPPELERMGILSFFSNYNIIPMGINNQQRINQIKKQYKDDCQKYLIASRPTRIQNSLSEDSKWEQENLPATELIKSGMLFPSESLPKAKALKIVLRTKPLIVLTERFTCISKIEDFAYVYIMLNGSWRSDEEMKAGQETWLKALEFHGLSVPINDGMLQYYQLLIEYMINSPRYSTRDINRTISMMNYDMIPYLNDIKEKVGIAEKRQIEEIIIELQKLNQARSTEILDLSIPPNNDNINQYINYSFTEEEVINSVEKLNNDYLPKLNTEQKYVFNQIKTRLDNHQQVKAFVKGKAGTGKSFLIHTIINYLISKNIPYIVCASTGIAASLIDGKTVHSAFGLFSRKGGQPDEEVICSLDVSRPNGYAMTKVKVIIVDEVTMISGKVLGAMNTGLKKIMSQISNNSICDIDFGGKSILLLGDLAQVPAVTRSFDDYLESLAQFHEQENYEFFNKWALTTIMRQAQDEVILLRILDFIRNYQDGQQFDEEIESELKKRFIPGLLENVCSTIDNFVGKDDPNGMVITFTNKNAQLYNQMILEERKKASNCNSINLQASFYIIEKTHFLASCTDSDDDAIKRQSALSTTRIATEKEIKEFCGAMKKKMVNSIIPFSLNIIANARVMLLQNIDVNAKLINGARGTIIDYISEVDAISVKFDFQAVEDNPILIMRRKSIEYQLENGKIIFMYMFPLKLSWAITSHKSQGQTLTKAAINIGESAFAHGSFYVALSRVKSLEGLIFFGLEQWPKGGPKLHNNPYIQYKENEQAENDFINDF